MNSSLNVNKEANDNVDPRPEHAIIEAFKRRFDKQIFLKYQRQIMSCMCLCE